MRVENLINIRVYAAYLVIMGIEVVAGDTPSPVTREASVKTGADSDRDSIRRPQAGDGIGTHVSAAHHAMREQGRFAQVDRSLRTK